MRKEQENMYLKNIRKKFKFNRRVYNLFYNQIQDFKNAENKFILPQHNYKLGDDVVLKKGTFMHGTRKGIDGLNCIKENGFLSTNIYNYYAKAQKTPYCVSMWNLQQDILLKDYINLYSGMTIRYTDFDDKPTTKLVPYNCLDKEIESSRNTKIWMWTAEQTKEIRFMPSLIRDDYQLAFILNMDNEYAKKMREKDIFNLDFDKKILKKFISDWFIQNYIYGKRDDLTTNREAAIIFGLPSCFVEGVFVGRILEKETDKLNEIKRLFPNCYICNLDGKVIMI